MKSLDFAKASGKKAPNKTEREYFEFIISGVSLRSILQIENTDLITPFGWSADEAFKVQQLNLFRLKQKPGTDNSRTMFYICPECGDIGCGAITALIIDEGYKIVWKDFGYENGNGNVVNQINIAPIEFERQAYFRAFANPDLR